VKPVDQKRVRSLLARLRVVIYVVLLVLIGYHLWRYDLVRLPPTGCSPLADLDPGTRMIVDLHPGELSAGDAVLYADGAGTLLLGRVGTPPPSAPAAVWAACRAGARWIVKEVEACPGDDSTRLGPLPREAIHGRIAGTVPW
jgi:hypothetical protein